MLTSAAAIFARLDRPMPGAVRTRAAASVVVRAPAGMAEPRPNAPLLIRIVRHPYGLFTGNPGRRQRYLPEVTPVDTLDRRAVLAAALAERREPWSAFASRARPRPFAVRPSRWILLAPEVV